MECGGKSSRVREKQRSRAHLESLVLDRSREAHPQGEREGRALGTDMGGWVDVVGGHVGAPSDEGNVTP